MVLLLLDCPKEVFVELSKLLEDSSVSFVLLAVLRGFDDGVDDLHDEWSVVSILVEFNGLIALLILFEFEILAYLYFAGEQEVVLLVLQPVDVCDGLSHARSASGDRGLRIVVGQVEKAIVKYVIDLHRQITLDMLQVEAFAGQELAEELIVFNCSDDFL